MSDWSDEPDDETRAAWDFIELIAGYGIVKNACSWGEGYPGRTPVGTVRSLEEFCEQFGIVSQPKFREYEPNDEDKRMLAELGIEA